MNNRPVFLNLMQIRLPITALTSILHRISGVVLFLAIPTMLWALQKSLDSNRTFNHLLELAAKPGGKLILFTILCAFSYHLIAGIRHLIMDCGYFESKECAQTTSKTVLMFFATSVFYIGYKVW